MNSYVKIGLFFIILGGAGTAYLVMASSGLNSLNTKPYEVTLPDATGLSTRSKVYLAGVAVGRVSAIRLEGREAHLRLALLKNVEVRQGAALARKSSSILGTSILALEPGPAAAAPIPPGGVIETDRKTPGMDEMLGTVRELSGQLSGILEEFQKSQMALITATLETFNSIAGKIDAKTDEELERVSRILESAAIIAEKTSAILDERGDDAGAAMGELRAALANINGITGEIRSGQGNLGRTVYDDGLYTGLLAAVQKTGEAADKLNTALEGAQEVINKATGLGVAVDAGARYDFLSGSARAQASLRIEPASNDRWYRVGVSSAPDGIPSRTITEISDENGNVTYYSDKTETTFPFSVDAELARRFGIFTLRGGLLESTAGLGLDIQPARWLSLSGEVFNFGDSLTPNLRGAVTFYPFFDPDSEQALELALPERRRQQRPLRGTGLLPGRRPPLRRP